MKAAWEEGVNFFDNAEAYEAGRSEEIMGAALKKLGWRRASYVVSTKIFFGMHDGVNERMTLNRKKLREGIDGALKRFGLDYIDLVFCHRPDPQTPIEETVWSMHMMVESGKALYWGTSEWNADQLMEAWGIAEKHHLHKPQMEQPQYNLFVRRQGGEEFRAAVFRHRPWPDNVEPPGGRRSHGQVQRRGAQGLAPCPLRLRLAAQ